MNSIAQHTPGPWKAFNKDGKHIQADEWSTDCDGASISTHAPIKAGAEVVALVVASSQRWPDLPDIAPNCRLIAAAPDLYACVQLLAGARRRTDEGSSTDMDALDTAWQQACKLVEAVKGTAA